MADLKSQLGTYLDHVVERLEVEDLLEERVVIVPVRPGWRRTRRSRFPGWVYGVAAAVVILLFFGGLAWLGDRSDVVDDPTPTTVRSQGSMNGLVAFAAHEGESVSYDIAPDHDIYVAREGEPARRIIGSDSDDLDQLCPAFSPDGAEMAHGQAKGTEDVGYTRADLVISNVDQDGNARVSSEINMPESSAPPCAIWSSDGKRIAIGVHEVDPEGSAGDVWVVDLATGETYVLPGLYDYDDPASSYSDMEWSPDGTELAIAGGHQISLYSVLTGELRILEGSSGAQSLSWSPGGDQIAYDSAAGIRVVDVDSGAAYELTGRYEAFHGVGPVWSPAGDRIVYQRTCTTYRSAASPNQPCREQHEVVLVSLDGSEEVLPHLRLPGANETEYRFPFRVTWSPDGNELLYLAWSEVEPYFPALIAVPLDTDLTPKLLAEYPGIIVYGEGFQLAVQSWARQADTP